MVELNDLPADRDGNNTVRRTGYAVFVFAWLARTWEDLWPRLVWAFLVINGFLIVSWFGLWNILPPIGRWIGTGLFAVAGIAALYPLRGFAFPSTLDIIRRIETRSNLRHRPISTQQDRLAGKAVSSQPGDVFAEVLWREHQNRMSGKLNNLASGMVRPKVNQYDPMGFRAILPILAVLAFGYSLSPNGGSVTQAFAPAIDAQQLRTRLDAWVNPPTYTRKPPIYLTRQASAQSSVSLSEEMPTTERTISIPAGSEFYLRFVGNVPVQLDFLPTKAAGEVGQDALAVEPKLSETVGRQVADEANETEFSTQVDGDGILVFRSGETIIEQWRFAVVPDVAPQIRITEEPSSALSGSLQLSFEVEDDYGVTSAYGQFKSLMPVDENARPLVGQPELKLPLPRSRAKSGTSKVTRDLTRHPWAGSAMVLSLLAEDDAGQIGQSETREIILPGRNFSHPLALAVIEQRRTLALDANRAEDVAGMLDVLTGFPEYIGKSATVIAMRTAYRRIKDASDDEALRDSLDLLWDIALGIEFGDLSDAERRLREAQENLSKALEEGASDEEIDRLMSELRQAMDEFMRQLAEQSRQNPMAQNPFGQNEMTQTLRQRDIERMMDQIENLAKSGSKDAAKQMLSELQRMMENLQAGRHQQQRQAEGNQTNQALDKLSELMQRQENLMNETSRMQRQQQDRQLNESRRQGEESQNRLGQNMPQQGQQRNQQQSQNGQQQQGQQSQNGENQNGDQQQGRQPGEMSDQELAEALKRLQEQQEALEQELAELGEQLEGLGLDPSQEFGEAGEQMGEAGERIGQGRTGDATGNQAQALDALRRGAQSMMQQMAGDRQQGGQQQGQQGQANSRRQGNDPLGRQSGENGMDAASDTRVPDEVDAQRAREIMEAIRRRLSNPLRPLIERDYLERLLQSR